MTHFYSRFKPLIPMIAFAFLLGIIPFFLIEGKGDKKPDSETGTESADNADIGRSPHSTGKTIRSARRSPKATFHQFIGMKLVAGDEKLFGDWSDKLSRNDDERQQRLLDLKHVKRAEVISFKMLEEYAGKLSTDQLPVDLPLPFFDGRTVTVRFNHLHVDGQQGGSLTGRLLDDPTVSVVLGFHQGETSGIIEGSGKIMFLDAVENETVILRELDAASHNADFQCDCQIHQAARKRASQTPIQE